MSNLALRPRSPFSFELVAGSHVDLALWLKERGFSCTIVITHPQHNRLERPAPHRERAIVLIFRSGGVLVQGNPQPRDDAIKLLRTLVIEDVPAAEQLGMFMSEARS